MSRRYSTDKYSRLEKQFYSKKNYNILQEVLLDSVNNVDNKAMPDEIYNTMITVFNNIQVPEITNKIERKKFITYLNKEVLSKIANKLKKNKTNNLKPVPIERFGNQRNIGHQFNPLQKQTEITNLPFNDSRNQMKSFYSRESIKPIKNPLLHPNNKLSEFPKPVNNTLLKNEVNLDNRFKQIEEERNNSIVKKPKPIDFTLPKNSLPLNNINPENKLNELMKLRNNMDIKINLENKSNQNTNKNNKIELIKKEIPSKDTFKPFVDNTFSNNNLVSFDNLKNNKLGTFMDGLDNKLLEAKEIIDKPNNLKEPPTPIKSQITNTTYLTILSLNRNSFTYPSPLSFNINFISDTNDIKYTKYQDEILFENQYDTKNQKPNINEIISIECLDVVLPKNNIISQEPFLWLCIKDWGLTNFGTYVPDNAFARLKIINEKNNFITLRPHILERQTPLTFPNKLEFEIKNSTGNTINIDDRIEIKNTNKNSLEINSLEKDIKFSETDIEILERDTKILKKGDRIYIFSLYSNNVIGFYPNIFMHDIKINKKNTMTFRLFIDKNGDKSNRIGKYIKDNDKKQIFAYKYLNTDDLFFLEYKKTSKKYKIIDIKNDLITIQFPQKRKYIPKNITRIGFIKKNNKGYTSNNINDINFIGGHIIKNINNNIIILDNNIIIPNNKYFLLQQKKQSNFMFRITYY